MTSHKLIQSGLGLAFGLGLVFVTACGSDIPVQELDIAHQQLESARAEDAAQYAADDYNAGREALLAAHQKLADDDTSGARSSAGEASALAIKSRQTAAPQFTAKQADSAKTELAQADEAYAEALAPRDFDAATRLYNDGNSLYGNAKSMQESGNDPLAVLDQYSAAANKFQASTEASAKARNLALSQKGDILDSLAGIESDLKKAETYGAEQENPEVLASARDRLQKARSLIEADKLKDGHAEMKLAEKEAAELLAQVESKYADSKLTEAREAVTKSQTLFKEIDVPANKKTAEQQAIIATLNEQVGAAGEALNSSEGFYNDKKYSDSINESEEAIRLSQIIYEQSNLLATARKADLDTGGSDEKTSLDGEAYTVRKARPADSLWRIAQKKEHYGNGHLWPRIYKANKSKIKNPNLIYPGQKFVIPPKTGEVKESVTTEESQTTEEGKTLEEQLKEEAAKKAAEAAQEKMEEVDEDAEQPRENME
ncbi:MAG: LysM peptidoglycan-binding domain-containing protein [Leptospiraceae bacterium]|nr:LysM peptidoglycan-binding domain-containing protein [Leptospiraceae bacterium]